MAKTKKKKSEIEKNESLTEEMGSNNSIVEPVQIQTSSGVTADMRSGATRIGKKQKRYRKSYASKVRYMLAAGYKLSEILRITKIAKSTFYWWIRTQCTFRCAVEEGRNFLRELKQKQAIRNARAGRRYRRITLGTIRIKDPNDPTKTIVLTDEKGNPRLYVVKIVERGISPRRRFTYDPDLLKELKDKKN